jgi:hypothetical protein
MKNFLQYCTYGLQIDLWKGLRRPVCGTAPGSDPSVEYWLPASFRPALSAQWSCGRTNPPRAPPSTWATSPEHLPRAELASTLGAKALSGRRFGGFFLVRRQRLISSSAGYMHDTYLTQSIVLAASRDSPSRAILPFMPLRRILLADRHAPEAHRPLANQLLFGDPLRVGVIARHLFLYRGYKVVGSTTSMPQPDQRVRYCSNKVFIITSKFAARRTRTCPPQSWPGTDWLGTSRRRSR